MISENNLDSRIIKFLEDAPLFFQPWWLEAAAPGRWNYAVVYRGDEIAALLPYAYKLRLKKFLLIEMPPVTPYLGPWLRSSTAKYANKLSEQKELMTELIDQLPKFSVFNQNFHHSVSNWLPFYWKGFQQTTRYTFLLAGKRNEDELWNETLDKVKTDVKKAQNILTVKEKDDLKGFQYLHSLTFERQNKRLPYDSASLQRLYEKLKEKNSCKILFAEDSGTKSHAAVLYVWDNKTVYYLLSGADPKLRNSGATSLLVWEGIKFAAASGKSFDFEGSVVEPIEKFVRAFGGIQTPFFTVYSNRSKIVSAYRKLVNKLDRGI